MVHPVHIKLATLPVILMIMQAAQSLPEPILDME